ncbi:MAG: NAD(P)H-hydrate epimerase, partial [Polyangiaceae bacterium]|nr:NAD(P)H-hydrate epimerase [Polyangiaceae bacterium]
MIPVLDRAQMRAYDRHAIEHCQVPGLVLMENAGAGAARRVAELARACSPGPSAAAPVVVVCGAGNNGGDGFVVARHLAACGLPVEVVLAVEAGKLAGDARANYLAWCGLGGAVGSAATAQEPLRAALERASLVVDALFGTGLDRPITGHLAAVVAALDAVDRPRVALDIPSGIDCDTGRVLGVAVRADMTVTFAHYKVGLLAGEGSRLAGRVVRVPLGFPDAGVLAAVGSRATVIEPARVRATLGRRPADGHKYRSGSLLVVAGSPGKVGAALLAGRAALRTGAGIVTLATSASAADALDAQVGELMTARLDPDALDATLDPLLLRRDAVAIGPGLGLDERARALCERIVLGHPGPVVVDADALTHFAGRAASLRRAAGARVLTPHEGELGRLLGVPSADVAADRFGAARRAADATGATV